MTPPRELNYFHTLVPPGTCPDAEGHNSRVCQSGSQPQRILFCGFAAARREYFRAGSFWLRSAFVGVASWGQYWRFRGRNKSKQNERSSAIPNSCSVQQDQSFLQFPECFGHTRRRLILRLRPIVRCVQRRCISLATETGPATPSQRSSPKFSHVTKCETSVSVYGHSRRAF